MITPGQLTKATDEISKLYSELENYILVAFSSALKDFDENTDIEQFINEFYKQIQPELNKVMKNGRKSFKTNLKDLVKKGIEEDVKKIMRQSDESERN